ncbi:hypothetical protein [Planococcus shenhongbingii]|uniref:Uncharacterized protein n=1 Tax=Planococcus shenhongbingii TaxID=3058398 RepID=A0ABT8N9X3_9BACL|nr:hypothetical protein [Planococcus sp. N017]MDN7244694.1 hypothetical protein [Planococcus sp. N017]
MKKYWKQLTIALTVVLLAVAGYMVYAFEFKEYESADEKVDEVTKEEIEVDLPDDTKIVVDADGKVTEEKDDKTEEDKEAKETDTEDAAASSASSSSESSSSSSNSNGSAAAVATAANTSQTASASTGGNSSNGSNGSNDNNGSGKNVNGITGSNNGNNGSNNSNGSNNGNGNGYNGNNGSNNGTKRVTVAQIKGKYETSLTRLEDTANARIDGLVNVAKNEYQADKSPNYAEYYNKYTKAASDLERNMDAAFYAVVDVMKRDLKAHGFAEAHVKSVVNEYENTKKQRRNALVKKAAGLK